MASNNPAEKINEAIKILTGIQESRRVEINALDKIEAFLCSINAILDAAILIDKQNDLLRLGMESTRELVYNSDIPHPASPEYREWHEKCQLILSHIDTCLEQAKGA